MELYSKEQNVLSEALLELTGLYWIGLHGTVNKGTQYKWATGQPVTFTYWDEDQPGTLIGFQFLH